MCIRDSYHCSKHGQGLRQCSMHYIRYDVRYAYVLASQQYWSMLAQKVEDKLLKRLLNASDRERNSAKKKLAAEMKKSEKRKAEVDGLFAKMPYSSLLYANGLSYSAFDASRSFPILSVTDSTISFNFG